MNDSDLVGIYGELRHILTVTHQSALATLAIIDVVLEGDPEREARYRQRLVIGQTPNAIIASLTDGLRRIDDAVQRIQSRNK